MWDFAQSLDERNAPREHLHVAHARQLEVHAAARIEDRLSAAKLRAHLTVPHLDHRAAQREALADGSEQQLYLNGRLPARHQQAREPEEQHHTVGEQLLAVRKCRVWRVRRANVGLGDRRVWSERPASGEEVARYPCRRSAMGGNHLLCSPDTLGVDVQAVGEEAAHIDGLRQPPRTCEEHTSAVQPDRSRNGRGEEKRRGQEKDEGKLPRTED